MKLGSGWRGRGWRSRVGLVAGFSVVLPLIGGVAGASEGAAGHANVLGPELLAIAVLLLAAKIGGDLVERLGQPAVLGELLIGVAIGNLPLLGYSGLEYIGSDPVVGFLAELGVIVLLFEVGLESNLREMLQVGLSAFLVAVLGVVTPFALGWAVSAIMFPDLHPFSAVFVGATLCATSVGITARVLRDMGVTRSVEGRIILGAAVVDDVLGLVILAVVAGLATGGGTGSVSAGTVLLVCVKSVLFLGLAIGLGRRLSPRLFWVASRLRASGMLISTALLFCLTLAYLADAIGLAGIVGAFAAGLILDEVHYKEYRNLGEHSVEELIRPISTFLVPIFFVRMGVSVDVTAFARPEVVGFALAVTLAAVAGKQACALGPVGVGRLNRLAVGLGMIPRGEVGLIFAAMGRRLTLDGRPVLDDVVFSALVVMVMVTTLVTPPLLRVAFSRGSSQG